MRILLTAFGPFHNYDENPSQLVLKEIIEQNKFIDILEFATVDVSYYAVNGFVANLKSDYDLIIHMGVASDNTKIRFELHAKNLANGKDVRNVEVSTAILNNNVNQLETNFPHHLLDKVVEKYPGAIVFSKDAGTYLCNYIYFKSLFKFQSEIPVLFVHTADFVKKENAPNIKVQSEIIEELISTFISNCKTKNLNV